MGCVPAINSPRVAPKNCPRRGKGREPCERAPPRIPVPSASLFPFATTAYTAKADAQDSRRNPPTA